MTTTTSLEFAHMVRAAAAAMRERGWAPVPGFRSPPRGKDVNRSIRWPKPGVDAPPTIAVRVINRAPRDVLLDILAGCLVVADIPAGCDEAGQFRAEVIRGLDVDMTPGDDVAPTQEIPHG